MPGGPGHPSSPSSPAISSPNLPEELAGLVYGVDPSVKHPLVIA